MPPGRTIGLLPGTDRTAGNPYLDHALATGLGEARDGALVSSADAVIAVGCNPGTLIEIGYALKLQRPLVVLAGWSVLDSAGGPVAGFRVAGTAAEAVAMVLGEIVPADGGSARRRVAQRRPRHCRSLALTRAPADVGRRLRRRPPAASAASATATATRGVGPLDGAVPRYAGPPTFARLPRLDEVPRSTSPCSASRSTAGVSYRPGRPVRPGAHPAALAAAAPVQPGAGGVAVRRPAGGRRRRHRGQPVRHRRGHRPDRGRRRELGRGRHGCWSSAATTPSRCRCCGRCTRLHGPIAVLHFDAHLDTWDTYFGAPYTHGTPFRRAVGGRPAGPRALPAHRHPRAAVRAGRT